MERVILKTGTQLVINLLIQVRMPICQPKEVSVKAMVEI